jgi:hypothetical protein
MKLINFFIHTNFEIFLKFVLCWIDIQNYLMYVADDGIECMVMVINVIFVTFLNGNQCFFYQFCDVTKVVIIHRKI